jgi:hypothetical protein
MNGTPMTAVAMVPSTTPSVTPTVSEGFSEYMARATAREKDARIKDARLNGKEGGGDHNGRTISNGAKAGSPLVDEAANGLGKHDVHARSVSPKDRSDVAHVPRPTHLFVADGGGRGVLSHTYASVSSQSAKDAESRRASTLSYAAHVLERGLARRESHDKFDLNGKMETRERHDALRRLSSSRLAQVPYEDLATLRLRNRDSLGGASLEDARNRSSLGNNTNSTADSHVWRDGQYCRDDRSSFEALRAASPPPGSAAHSDLQSVGTACRQSL